MLLTVCKIFLFLQPQNLWKNYTKILLTGRKGKIFMESKSKNILISVVITAFNEEKYLPKCLAALKNQKYPKDKFSITVVDNNSTDRTVQIAKKFGARVISEKKQGNTFALKRGMDEAKGEIIAVTEADTQVDKNWLWTINKIFLDSKVVGATGSMHIDAKSKITGRLIDIAYLIIMHIGVFIGKPNLSGFNFAVRRQAFLKVDGINALFGMSSDVDLGVRLSKIGKIRMVNGLHVTTSFRRFEKSGLFPTLWDYVRGHIYAAWLCKPPLIKQAAIR